MNQQDVINRNRPLPEIIGRNDGAPIGPWDVRNVRAVRGEPYAAVSIRQLAVPMDDSELASAIRGHEMVHVKISPQIPGDYASDVTPLEAVMAAEEVRTNYVAGKLGFPMQSLVAGSERQNGEQVTKAADWYAAVMFTAACLHTGGLNHYITGVRSVDTVWADQLRDIAKEIEKFQKKQLKNLRKQHVWMDEQFILREYCSTALDTKGRLKGMGFTIELAMLLESIAAMPAPEMSGRGRSRRKSDDTSSDDTSNASGSGSEGSLEPGKGKPDAEDKKLRDKQSKLDRDALQKRAEAILNESIASNGIGDWIPVRVADSKLSVTMPGALARRKQPAVFGRQVKRPERLFTDPKMRLFEQKRRVQGGVVLIDCSGSMKLSTKDVESILLAAPGCTVIAYATNWLGDPNTHILADNGKMVAELPRFFSSNGCDLPALQFALSKRGNPKNPVIWVTDGIVYRPGLGGEYDQRECALFARRNGVHMEYTPAKAVVALKQLAAGGLKPKLIPRWAKLVG